MSRNVVSCTQSGGQGNDFELIPTVQVKGQHSTGAPTSRDFPRFEIISPEVGSRSQCYEKTCTFGKKTTPCGKILKISFLKDLPPRRFTSCVQVVKFGRPEIGKVVRY